MILLLAEVPRVTRAVVALAVPSAIVIPIAARSYRALALELRDPDGRILPGLRRWIALRTGRLEVLLEPIILGWSGHGRELAELLAAERPPGELRILWYDFERAPIARLVAAIKHDRTQRPRNVHRPILDGAPLRCALSRAHVESRSKRARLAR